MDNDWYDGCFSNNFVYTSDCFGNHFNCISDKTNRYRTNRILDDVERKSKSLDGLFNVIDGVTDTLSMLSDTLVTNISGVIYKIFHKDKKKRKKKEIEEDE